MSQWQPLLLDHDFTQSSYSPWQLQRKNFVIKIFHFGCNMRRNRYCPSCYNDEEGVDSPHKMPFTYSELLLDWQTFLYRETNIQLCDEINSAELYYEVQRHGQITVTCI